MVAEQGEIANPLTLGLENGKRGRGHRRLEAKPEKYDLPVGMLSSQRERIERRINHAHVGTFSLCLQQALLGPRHAHGVTKGRENHAGCLCKRHAIVHAPHGQYAHRTAGPVHQLDGLGQHGLDTELENRVRVPAANLHDGQGTVAADVDPCHELVDLAQERLRLIGITELVDIFHGACSFLLRGAYLQMAAVIGQQGMHQVPEDVIDGDVAFLDAVNAVGLDDKAVI